MTDLEKAAMQALEALEDIDGIDTETECVTIDVGDVITALRQSLEQPAPVAEPRKQEPVAWRDEQGNVRMTIDSGEIQSSVGYVYSVHGEHIKNACIRSDIPNGTPLYTRPAERKLNMVDPELQDKDPQLIEQPAPATEAHEQEPVATKLETQQFNCFHVSAEDFQKLKDLPVGTKLYTSPPAQRKPLTDELKDAFFDGFTSVETYNDTLLNSPEEAWEKYKAAHGIKGDA